MDIHIYDAPFKRMAIDLTYARGSVKEAANELYMDFSRLSKWRQKDSLPVQPTEGPADEPREIMRLQKEMSEAQLERDILRKAICIFSRGDGRYLDS